MSGSRLGRGRGGRLALYGGCAVAVILTMIVYRNTISEMTRLQEMQVQCLHQQESLAAQLQVIFEYKVRLEKSLAEEKSSNAAVKQELQQRASREKSLRDKDSIEAMQRFNSLQQTYKLLQTEHQDLQEECKKREKQTLDETNRLESTLQDLRARIRQAQEDKFKALENLKTKYLEIIDEKTSLQQKYNDLIKNRDNTGSTVDHLRKEIFQLRRELESAKNFYARSTPPSSVLVTPRASVSQSALPKEDSQPIPAPQQQQQQQVSAPRPPYVSYDRRTVGRTTPSVEKMNRNDDANEPANSIRFVQKNGNIVPAGPNEVKEIGEQREPSANDLEQKQQKEVVKRPNVINEEKNDFDEEERKQVMSPPLNRNDDNPRNDNASAVPGSQAEQPLVQSDIERTTVASGRSNHVRDHAGDDELQALQERIDGIFNRDNSLDFNLTHYHVFTTGLSSACQERSYNLNHIISILTRKLHERLIFYYMVSSRKAENTTVANNANLISPSLIDKPAPLPARLLSKVKVPLGVLPIPEIIEQKVVDDMDEKKRQEEIREDAAAVRNNLQPPPKLAVDKEEKEPVVEAGNLDPPFVVNPPVRHVGEQLDRRAKESWLRVGPGVQEVGEELNRIPGLDDGQANGGDDQYDGADYDKESQQKNDIHLAVGEDEGEDEGDMLDYPHNLKQGKRE
ncbi:Golgi integral membrane protein 4 [Cyphomyrmex costatus]|uniref:Golgi integral membrane protein 4 n=1 Tax=Cyphomyrmex costatus TaxID=456900 RepID=A0A195C272_9HYME|nr:Golgi integral membrane protein 4 [Cyphomyrmex costatus]